MQGRKETLELLRRESVKIIEQADDWKDAIRISVRPLEDQGAVEVRYKEEIIANIENMGSYIVIAPFVALPHARPEQGVLESQIAVTLLKKPVIFDDKKDPVKLLIALAAADNNRHLDALAKISEILQDEEKTKEIMEAKDQDVLYSYF